MQEEDLGAKAVSSLLERLNVTPAGADAFVGPASRGGGPRLFGGMVAGQAVVAAARTVEGPQIHSLHAYFLQPGDPALDVSYRVDRLKEGKNFQARQITARQSERVIFSMQASFQRAEPGFSHQDPMPDAPDPDTLQERGFGFWGASSPVRMRDCDGGDFDRAAKNGMRRVWMKPSAALPEDPVLHLGLLVFATDMTLVMTGMLPHPELRQRPRGGASLDHAVWFHRQPLFDDWLLYTMATPVAHASRPLMHGAMYRRDGTRVASIAQEGLIRFR
ncbi:MAG: acyl-CoA thioesterase [Polyangiales bacterium]